jgi:hypothetical protein
LRRRPSPATPHWVTRRLVRSASRAPRANSAFARRAQAPPRAGLEIALPHHTGSTAGRQAIPDLSTEAVSRRVLPATISHPGTRPTLHLSEGRDAAGTAKVRNHVYDWKGVRWLMATGRQRIPRFSRGLGLGGPVGVQYARHVRGCAG